MEETKSMIREIEELLVQTPDDDDLVQMLNALQQQYSPTSLYSSGSPCSLPFRPPWSNATILLPGRVLGSKSDSGTVQVLILTPLTQETIPCSSLLSSSDCDTQHCLYSHGYPVKEDWLLPIETMDIYNTDRHYQPNSTILYKCTKDNDGTTTNEQHLWKKATLRFSDIDSTGNHQWHISTEEGDTNIVGENQVIPLVYLDEEPDSSDNFDSAEYEDVDQMHGNTTIGNTNQSFGAWQSHTSGFGEKMMKKMGYVEGEGLGTTRQGRLEPVQAYDKGTHYSQSKRPGLGSLDKKKKVKTNIKKVSVGTSSMFDMMNTILDHDTPTRQRDDVSSRKGDDGTPKKDQRRLWQLQDKLDRLNKEWQQGMAAVKRNKGTTMEREFQAKVDSITQQIKSIKQDIALVQGSLTRTKNYEKMITF